jgi:group I intron endonuclease
MTAIYLITSPTGKVYIGQSRNIKNRFNHYGSNSSCPGQPKLHSSIKSHGWSAHTVEILHELPEGISQKLLDTYEIFYISLYKLQQYEMLNLRGGGTLDWHHAETRKKFSIALKNREPHNKGKKTSPETKTLQREKALARIKKEGRGNLDRTGKEPWNKNKKKA